MRCLFVLPVTVLWVSLTTAENMNKKRTLSDSNFSSHTALLGAYTIPTFYTVSGAINPALGDSLGRNGNGHFVFVGGNHGSVLPEIAARESYRTEDSRKESESDDDSYDNSEENKENISALTGNAKTEDFGSADSVKDMYNDNYKTGGGRTFGHSGGFRSHSGGRTGATFIGKHLGGGHEGAGIAANQGSHGVHAGNGYTGGYESGRAGGSHEVVGGRQGIVGLNGNKGHNSLVGHPAGRHSEAQTTDTDGNHRGSSVGGYGFGNGAHTHGFSDEQESRKNSGSLSELEGSEIRTHGGGIGGGHVSGAGNHGSSYSAEGRGNRGSISAYVKPIEVQSSGGYGGNYGGYGGGSNVDFVAGHGNNEVIIEVGQGEGISSGHYGGSGGYSGANGGHSGSSGSLGGYGSGGYGSAGYESAGYGSGGYGTGGYGSGGYGGGSGGHGGGYGGVSGSHGVGYGGVSGGHGVGYGGVSGGHGGGYGGGYASGGSANIGGGSLLFHKGGSNYGAGSGSSYGSYGGSSGSSKGYGGSNGGGSGKATSYQTVHLESLHAVPVYFKNAGKH